MDDDEPWWHRALCAQVGPDLFFLNYGEPGTEAKQVCRMCPVRAQCLADAAKTELEHGIFGGFGRDERRAVTRAIERGVDPLVAAQQAIDKETNERRTRDRDRPARRGRGDRLHPRASGRPQERPGVEAQRVRAQ